jgi:blue copper oxidase
MLSRRTFMLQSSALFASTTMIGAPAACARPSGVRLPMPALLDAASNQDAFALRAQEGLTRFSAAVTSPTRGFNGSFLGPTILLRNGRTTRAEVTNGLDESTTVHWHGLLIPSESDGGPHHLIQPRATWRTVLDVRQPQATLWYHAHPHPRTGPQIYSGLAGMLIVSDGADQDLGLPSRYGIDDIPLIIRDAVLEQGRLVYPAHPMNRMWGVRGATILANGAVGPTAAVPRGLVRLRLANAANARVFVLWMSDSRQMLWIGTDGGLLAAPVPLRSLTLAPGQRAEVLLDFSSGSEVALITAPDPTITGSSMGMHGMGMEGMADPLGRSAAVVHFVPRGSPSAVRWPTRLPALSFAETRATKRRRMALTMSMGHGMGMGMRGGMMERGMGGRARGGGPMAMMGNFGIDGQPFALHRVDHEVRRGDTEIWEVSADMMQHPLHIHGAHFHVLSRGGQKPGVMDQGLKDTVLVQEPVEMLVQFTKEATDKPFMFHCHTLEHEDGGMMGQFKTIG